MRCKGSGSYPLDNSAIIHLAARRKNYTNGFRIAITLKEAVCAEILQKAVIRITLRFPTIIAGIQKGFFQYHVVPCTVPLRVRKEEECLAPMTNDEIRNCAFRVLYSENRIITEYFHSLTDGYGGIVVANTLVAEYLRLKYSISVPATEITLDVDVPAEKEELSDDYFFYAGHRAAAPKTRAVYQLPGQRAPIYRVQTTTGEYETAKVLRTAHHYGVSVTTFLTAIMALSVIEIQNRHQIVGQHKKPVQVMVPVNLRRIFPSQSLRNFSLYALPCIEPQDEDMVFEKITKSIGTQIAQQTTKDYMAAALSMNTKAQCFPLYRLMPLPFKLLILRVAHQLFGENNSCISLSNLGQILLPDNMCGFIEKIDFILTPRIQSPYNCGVVSFNGIMSINFSRICMEPELEQVFFKKLEQAMEIIEPIKK